MAALRRPTAPARTYELGGPEVLTLPRAPGAGCCTQTGRHRPLVDVPMGLARLQAAVLERLPGKLLTRDQLLMLGRDNVVAPDAPGLATSGMVPTPMDMVVPAYLAAVPAAAGSGGQ